MKFIRNGYGMSEIVAAAMVPPPKLSEDMMRYLLNLVLLPLLYQDMIKNFVAFCT